MNKAKITPEQVRHFLLTRYAVPLKGKMANPTEIPDNFDFLLEGIIDSFGVLELVGEVEKEFGLELDMSGLDAEQMTVLGPLSRYVAGQRNSNTTHEGSAGPAT
jgi:acyl carrier protein